MASSNKRFSLSNLSLPLSSQPASRSTSPQLVPLPLSSPAARGSDPFGSSGQGAMVIQRDDMQKQLRALDQLLQLLASYQTLVASLAKTESKLSKACTDVLTWSASSNSTGSAEVVYNSLASSSQLFSSLSSVSTKHSKTISSTVSALQDALIKHFKKISKLERTHETFVVEKEVKLRKSAGGLEKSLGRAGGKNDALLGALKGLGEEINNSKEAHAIHTSHLQTSALLLTASHLTAIASSQFTASTEGVRKTAPVVGEVHRWKALADVNWQGFAGVGSLSLVSPTEDEDEHDEIQEDLQPPDRSTFDTLDGAPSSPRLQKKRPSSSPLVTGRQLPVLPRSPSLDVPSSSPVSVQRGQPIGRSTSSDGTSLRATPTPPPATASPARKKVAYSDETEIIPRALKQEEDEGWDALKGRSDYESLLREEQRRVDMQTRERERRDFEAAEERRQVEVERERAKAEEAERERQRRLREEEAERERARLRREAEEEERLHLQALEREREGAERKHQALLKREEEEAERRLMLRREEDERIRWARDKEDRERQEALENARLGSVKVRSMKERIEEFKKSVPPPSTPTPTVTLGRRVSQLSARYEDISSHPTAPAQQPQGPRRIGRKSDSAAFDPTDNTRPLNVPPPNHRRTTYPLTPPTPLYAQGSGSLISMANGGGVLMRESDLDERGWTEAGREAHRAGGALTREESVKEGEMRFKEPTGSQRGRAGQGQEWR